MIKTILSLIVLSGFVPFSYGQTPVVVRIAYQPTSSAIPVSYTHLGLYSRRSFLDLFHRRGYDLGGFGHYYGKTRPCRLFRLGCNAFGIYRRRSLTGIVQPADENDVDDQFTQRYGLNGSLPVYGGNFQKIRFHGLQSIFKSRSSGRLFYLGVYFFK